MDTMGSLTYTTDGSYYYVWWHPSDESHTVEHSVVLASVAVKLLSGVPDFKAWQKEVEGRYEGICQSLFGKDLKLQMEIIGVTKAN